jgi:hypothetical protein
MTECQQLVLQGAFGGFILGFTTAHMIMKLHGGRNERNNLHK